MNYRHGFHAGNHADVLKHVVLLALLDALQKKPAGLMLLDSHAGRGRYPLHEGQASRTGEAQSGILRLRQSPPRDALLQRYLQWVEQAAGNLQNYPGSPLLLAQRLRQQDRLVACEIQPGEAEALRSVLAPLPRCSVHERDGYEALPALLPPPERRGLLLIDPPYEQQVDEYALIERGLSKALERFPSGTYALWYPIKQRALLRPPMRRLAKLPAKQILSIELLIRPDDSPLRLNGSGMLLLNPPWQIEKDLQTTLFELRDNLGEAGSSCAMTWLKSESP